jgi:phasin family protein
MAGNKKRGKKKASSRSAVRPAAKMAEPANDKQRSTIRKEKTMTEGKAKFEKLSQDATVASKEHVEALARSGSVFAKGCEDFLKTYAAMAQSAAERNAQAFKALLGSKTLTEFTETQSRVAQENLDDFLSGITKLSELGVRVATETFEPLNDQISQSIKKAGDALAA